MSTTQTTILTSAIARALMAAQHQQHLCMQAAVALDEADLHVIAHAFRFTAAQEGEHAVILRGLLPEPAPAPEAEELLPDAAPGAWLSAAIGSESACSGELLPEAIRAAALAGQPRAAATLQRIAENDRDHARRFLQYLHALEDGSLLHGNAPTSWFCLPCGCLYHGAGAPDTCESCGASRGHFIRSSFHPFALA